MASKKVVVTGAPGTGKTVLVNTLEERGYKCFHEIIRTMTAAALEAGTEKEQVSNPLVFVDDPLKFNSFLLEGRLRHLLESKNLEEEICFFDRGTPDVLAYMDYFDQNYDDSFIEICKVHRYDKVFILPPWKEIYVRDNERLETFEEAKALHENLMNTYKRFGYKVDMVPKGSIEERVAYVLDNTDIS
ncbi:AAA family ATPase [Croceivirga thetidis]|uniref:ATP-binding protein n=1 Tax=Croceivirga thetidis TaxID=2721623 RepID=A0ABX1GQ75_9FLAO|nr:ATP-binding protein [Croceivirga thetidis]NKI32060.1 ATP-binding protein [Croceivirga thetidis]